MDKATQPQQLSFLFDEPFSRQTVVNLAAPLVKQVVSPDITANLGVVYDFQSAASKRKESTEALLYRQILDSVRHIG